MAGGQLRACRKDVNIHFMLHAHPRRPWRHSQAPGSRRGGQACVTLAVRSAVKPEIQPVCAPRCKTSLCPCCKRDSSGELVLIRGIRTVAFFLFCCVGSMRTLGPWILSVFELLTMVALNVVVNPGTRVGQPVGRCSRPRDTTRRHTRSTSTSADSPSPSHLPGNIHNYALSFCCHVEDVFAISIVRSVVLSVAYGAGACTS